MIDSLILILLDILLYENIYQKILWINAKT